MKQQYFGTDGIRGRVGEKPMTVEFIRKIGFSISQCLKENDTVIIGGDTRESSAPFAKALADSLSAEGINVLLAGVIPTPVVALLTRLHKANAGIVVSASHNPYYDNGVKLFSPEGTKISDEMELRIEQWLDNEKVGLKPKNSERIIFLENAKKEYWHYCEKHFKATLSLKGLHIIVDCANGATYETAPYLFKAFGAKVETLHAEPNGKNINEHCGSTHPESLREKVLEKKADMGIAFDGDGDRVLMVDHKGEILDGDELLMIIVNDQFQQNTLKGGVVGTVMTNLGLELALKECGIDFLRTKVGDRFVVEALQEKGWQLGGESSGHILNFALSTTGDGILSALLVLQALQNSKKSLHEAKQLFIKCPQVMINVQTKDKAKTLQNNAIKVAVLEAERQLAGRGRVLLRPSGTEPLIRVMVEGESEALVKQLAECLADVVRNAQ